MTEPDPAFDAVHPSGHILFRTCRGGYLHSVTLAEEATDTDAQTLAQAVLLTAEVSYLKALMEVRAEIIASGHTPSPDVPTEKDLLVATEALQHHRLRPAQDR
ncbi:MAG TPA: DUF2694 family protein [Mycobacterium sp.]|nr:DUF2694 family protein [Mycobacterium sp.]